MRTQSGRVVSVSVGSVVHFRELHIFAVLCSFPMQRAKGQTVAAVLHTLAVLCKCAQFVHTFDFFAHCPHALLVGVLLTYVKKSPLP